MALWRRQIRPHYVIPPAEPAALDREVRVANCDRHAWNAWLRGDLQVMDGWLDTRNAIRPPCPDDCLGSPR